MRTSSVFACVHLFPLHFYLFGNCALDVLISTVVMVASRVFIAAQLLPFLAISIHPTSVFPVTSRWEGWSQSQTSNIGRKTGCTMVMTAVCDMTNRQAEIVGST